MQAAPSQKLPALYLLDSISKLVGEPYKTLFAATLPEVGAVGLGDRAVLFVARPPLCAAASTVGPDIPLLLPPFHGQAFMSAWQAGGPGLHRPLDKLLGTWTAVYPQALLADIQARVAASRAGAAAAVVQPPAGGFATAGGGFGFAPTAPLAPMVPDPRLAQQQQQQAYVQAPAFQQQPMQPMGGYGAAPMQQQQPMQPAYYQQPAAQQPLMQPQAVQQPAAALQQVNVPDLLSSLMDAGLLAAPGAAQPAAPLLSHSTPPYVSAATATPDREQPASTKLTPDRIKVHVGRRRRLHYFAPGPPTPTMPNPLFLATALCTTCPACASGRCTPGIHPLAQRAPACLMRQPGGSCQHSASGNSRLHRGLSSRTPNAAAGWRPACRRLGAHSENSAWCLGSLKSMGSKHRQHWNTHAPKPVMQESCSS